MGHGRCSACTAFFTLLTFLNCLSQNKAQIPPGTACARGCFLAEHLWQILIPHVLALSALSSRWEWRKRRMLLLCERVNWEEAGCSLQGVPELS